MCEVQPKDRERSKNLMLGLNTTIDQLSMANIAHWHSGALRREDGHVSGKAL